MEISSVNPKSLVNLHIIFFGNDDFSLSHLKPLINCCIPAVIDKIDCETDIVEPPNISKLEIITSNDFTIIANYCASVGVPYQLWPSIADSCRVDADIGVVAAFGRMLPASLIGAFSKGIINVHPSLLPRWRGSSPIIHSLLHADTLVGVTILEVSAGKFDHGHILCQSKPIEIDPMTHDRKSLTQLLSNRSRVLLLAVLSDIDGYRAQATVQPTVGVTVARKIDDTLTEISWNTQTARQVDTIYRAAGDRFPLHSHCCGVEAKLCNLLPSWRVAPSVAVYLQKRSDVPGSAAFLKWLPDYFYVRCTDSWVGFGAIHIGRQSDSRKLLTALEFFNGYLYRFQKEPRAVVFG